MSIEWLSVPRSIRALAMDWPGPSSFSSILHFAPDTMTDEQEKVLLELEMILTTVHQINQNLESSIALLRASPTNMANPGRYQELVKQNAEGLRKIMAALESV